MLEFVLYEQLHIMSCITTISEQHKLANPGIKSVIRASTESCYIRRATLLDEGVGQ